MSEFKSLIGIVRILNYFLFFPIWSDYRERIEKKPYPGDFFRSFRCI